MLGVLITGCIEPVATAGSSKIARAIMIVDRSSADSWKTAFNGSCAVYRRSCDIAGQWFICCTNFISLEHRIQVESPSQIPRLLRLQKS